MKPQNEVTASTLRVAKTPPVTEVFHQLSKYATGYVDVRGGNAAIKTYRDGFGRAEIDRVAALAQLTKKEIATLLGVSERQLYNPDARPLSALQSEHLAHLENLFQHGLVLFDQNGQALTQWLRTPKMSLAVPETGYPLTLPATYEQPGLDKLFAPLDAQIAEKATQQNLTYKQELNEAQTDAFPTPLSILDTITGVRLVATIFGQIEAGVFN